jgi:hypothetical protein
MTVVQNTACHWRGPHFAFKQETSCLPYSSYFKWNCRPCDLQDQTCVGGVHVTVAT